MDPVLSVRELTKRYGAVVAARDVSFEVFPGEILGLLGPNGAGKTTTIECILGLRRPSTGTVSVAGIDALAEPVRVRPLIGAQLQSTALPDQITPRQALRLFGAFYRPRPDVEALLDRFGLSQKSKAPFYTLSGGQRQRLTLALAFVNAPRLLVLDEPTVGLDPVVRRELLNIVSASRDEGCAVLMSTHQLDEAERLCDRLAVVDGGRIVAIGRPDELIARTAAPTRVTVRTARPVARDSLSGLPGVEAMASNGDTYVLTTTDPNRTVMELTQLVMREQTELHALEIHRPTLEDAFLELTGRSWPESADAA